MEFPLDGNLKMSNYMIWMAVPMIKTSRFTRIAMVIDKVLISSQPTNIQMNKIKFIIKSAKWQSRLNPTINQYLSLCG